MVTNTDTEFLSYVVSCSLLFARPLTALRDHSIARWTVHGSNASGRRVLIEFLQQHLTHSPSSTVVIRHSPPTVMIECWYWVAIILLILVYRRALCKRQHWLCQTRFKWFMSDYSRMNRGRRARIWRQILHWKWLNSPNVAPNPT